MAKATVFVASPRATGSTPVAIGSRVPACPALAASRSRFSRATAVAEVMPDGLSITSQPSIFRPLGLRAIAVLVLRSVAQIPAHVMGGEIAGDGGTVQQAIELGCTIERRVGLEDEFGEIAQLDLAGELCAQIGCRPPEPLHQRRRIPAPERQHEGCGMAEIGADPHLGHRDGNTHQVGITKMPALEDARQGVSDFLADPLLTLGLGLEMLPGHAHHGLRSPPGSSRRLNSLLQRACDLFDLVALDDVALLHILVILEGHAAVITLLHLAHILLEAAQAAEPAVMYHHAARDLADLADGEDLAYLGVAQQIFLNSRRQEAREHLLHVVDDVVDDRVVADLQAVAPRELARLRIGADIEADDQCLRRCRQGDIRLVDAADPRVEHAYGDLVRRQALDRVDDRLDRPLDVRLDHDRKLLRLTSSDLRAHLLDGVARATRDANIAKLALTEFGHFPRTHLVLDDAERIAGERRAVEPQHLDGRRRTRGVQRAIAVIEKRTHASPLAAGDEDVANPESAALNKHRGDRAAAAL